MPRSRYILVLARSPQAASIYARRAGLARGSYRAVAAAKSIRGIQVADVHILPDFHERRDSHAILAELRWARDIRTFEVEMPKPAEQPPVDQGDGMGEQLTIFDALSDETPKEPEEKPRQFDAFLEKVLEDPETREAYEEIQERETLEKEPEAPKKRRSRCKTCGRLTFAAFEASPEGHDREAHQPSVAASRKDLF